MCSEPLCKKEELFFSVYCFKEGILGLGKGAVGEVREYAALQKRQTLEALELIPTAKIIHKTSTVNCLCFC